MTIRTIYIDPKGIVKANPGMPLPLHFKQEFDYTQDDIEDYADAIKKYHSGLLPFEDQFKVKYLLPVKAKYVTHHEPQNEEYQLTPNNRQEAMRFGDEVILPLNTIVHISPIEVEVVTKEQEEWSDETGAFMIEYKILRIKN